MGLFKRIAGLGVLLLGLLALDLQAELTPVGASPLNNGSWIDPASGKGVIGANVFDSQGRNGAGVFWGDCGYAYRHLTNYAAVSYTATTWNINDDIAKGLGLGAESIQIYSDQDLKFGISNVPGQCHAVHKFVGAGEPILMDNLKYGTQFCARGDTSTAIIQIFAGKLICGTHTSTRTMTKTITQTHTPTATPTMDGRMGIYKMSRQTYVYNPGDTIVYIISVTNSAGVWNYENVDVYDSLPTNVELVAAAPSVTPAGQYVKWDVTAVPAGQTRNFTLTLSYTGDGKNVTNTASAWDTMFGVTNSSQVRAVFPLTTNTLNITKSASVATVANPGDEFDFIITLENYDGNRHAVDVEVWDTLPANVEIISTGPEVTPTGQYCYWDLATLEASGTAAFTITVSYTGDGKNITNTAKCGETLSPIRNANTVSVEYAP